MPIHEKIVRYLGKIFGEQVHCTDIHPRQSDGRYVVTVMGVDGKKMPMLTPYFNQPNAVVH